MLKSVCQLVVARGLALAHEMMLLPPSTETHVMAGADLWPIEPKKSDFNLSRFSNPKPNPKCPRLPRIFKYLAVPNSLVSC